MVDHLELIDAAATPNATVKFEMAVTPALGSRMGNMHGGAIALVYDMCTTMCAAPLARKDFWWFGGVSRTLSVTYLRPVKVGMRIVVECEVLQIGSRLGEQRSPGSFSSAGRIY
jgi:acyl-coenzyme A thioesterase 13